MYIGSSTPCNADEERWVRSVREECLDRLMHLNNVLREYEISSTQGDRIRAWGQRSPINPRKIQPAEQSDGAIGSALYFVTTTEPPDLREIWRR